MEEGEVVVEADADTVDEEDGEVVWGGVLAVPVGQVLGGRAVAG